VGIAADLGYVLPPPTRWQRGVQVLASSRAGAWALARAAPPLDRVTARLSHGHASATGALAALPVLVVTTTGRRSGRPRPAQLVGVPWGDTVALLGTNFGQASTPTWALNLEADPRATVAFREAALDVVARPATESERPEVLDRAARLYPGYPKYARRVTGRTIRVFVLEPAPPAAA
jgi:deazaflavin-dependent oxidoreductase (nitroreductase family)